MAEPAATPDRSGAILALLLLTALLAGGALAMAWRASVVAADAAAAARFADPGVAPDARPEVLEACRLLGAVLAADGIHPGAAFASEDPNVLGACQAEAQDGWRSVTEDPGE